MSGKEKATQACNTGMQLLTLSLLLSPVPASSFPVPKQFICMFPYVSLEAWN